MNLNIIILKTPTSAALPATYNNVVMAKAHHLSVHLWLSLRYLLLFSLNLCFLFLLLALLLILPLQARHFLLTLGLWLEETLQPRLLRRLQILLQLRCSTSDSIF